MIAFLRLFRWFSLRQMARHPARAAAVLLGVALGAAVFTSVRLAVHASVDSFSRSMDRLAGQAESVLLRPGGRVDDKIIADLLTDPAVRDASPVLRTHVLPDSGDAAKREPFLLLGFDPILDRDLRDWETATETGGDADPPWLELIRTPYSLILGKPLADRLGVQAGERLPLIHQGRRVEFQVAGVLETEGLGLAEGGELALSDIATFQEFTGRLGVADRIDLRLRPDSDPKTRLQGLIPPDLRLVEPDRARKGGRRMVRAYQLNLSVLSFVSLFTGMFLVYSLVALNAAARRREVAILRSIGAERRTVFALFLGEGAVLGILGWLVAVPVSAALVRYLLDAISQTISTLFVRVRVDQLRLDPWELALSFSATLAVSLLAAALPAREATAVDPVEALAPDRRPVGRVAARRLALGGLACVALVWPVAQFFGSPGFPLPGYLATFLLFAGFALLSPWLLERLGIGLGPLLRRFGGEPARLAGGYLQAGGVRTAVAVGSLITAVALYTALVVMITSFRGSVSLWAEQSVSGDLFIRPTLVELNHHRDVLPEETIQAVRELDMAVTPVPYRRVELYRGDLGYQIDFKETRDFLEHGRFVWVAGDPEAARPKLFAGEGAVVSEVFGAHAGLTVGDRFQADVAGGTVDLPVVGLVRDYRTHGGVVFIDMSVFRKIRGPDAPPEWTGVRFYIHEDVSDSEAVLTDLRARLVRCCGDGLELTNGRDLRAGILRIFDETFSVTTVLLVIALAVAALGIATTLTVTVLERSRQINTILAVGGSPGQIRAMVVWESFLMVTAGEGAGLVCGMILSWLLVYVVNYQSFGWTFLYQIDPGKLALSVPLVALAALGAAIPAVRHAFREPPAVLLRER
jgi:putative ABC transport system permease protein